MVYGLVMLKNHSSIVYFDSCTWFLHSCGPVMLGNAMATLLWIGPAMNNFDSLWSLMGLVMVVFLLLWRGYDEMEHNALTNLWTREGLSCICLPYLVQMILSC